MTDPEQFDLALAEGLAAWKLELKPEQRALLRAHYEAMVETNRTTNLTRIVEPAAAAWKHYLDSLAVLLWLRQRPGVAVRSVLDIGTGAGFPAVPLAVAKPNWRVVAIDGTSRKIDFLAEFAGKAGPANLEARHAHSAHFESDERFDLVVLRAVGSLSIGLEQAFARLHRGGHVVAYKTPAIDADEDREGAASAKRLGFTAIDAFAYELTLPDGPAARTLRTTRRRR